MPEGDTVYRAARALDVRLRGATVRASDFRVPQHATADLSGARVLGTSPRGKHLLTRFDLDGAALTLHTHLRMDGSWTVLAPGKVLPRRLQPDVRVLLRTDGASAAGLKLPVVELLPTAQEHTVVGHLGPDPLDAVTPVGEVVAAAVRNLAADPRRPLAAALLDQRNLAGLGNLWVNELCFLRGHLPTRPVGEVALEPLVRLAVKMLRFSISGRDTHQVTTGDTRPGRQHWVYGRGGQPCLRCGTPVEVSAEVPGDPERRWTWWCPHCQR
ncbi:Fpg/Nei family DNA glycosylase [Kineococcus indalonis]|uniref:Fpg/Nei family DNA glycosylase n=1 Tax=Kineococcus indalonis TaxID=2696566 RepID=UPI001412C600|nr:Fpg/Nei family DNA glycosylase [Kineococcus indalonis]NAZ85132.1 Fpg/Nei family DNA glycosylase [Kineococcus indalonis]